MGDKQRAKAKKVSNAVKKPKWKGSCSPWLQWSARDGTSSYGNLSNAMKRTLYSATRRARAAAGTP